MDKITFKNLSWPLQIITVFGFIMMVLYILLFMVGFVAGFMGW